MCVCVWVGGENKKCVCVCVGGGVRTRNVCVCVCVGGGMREMCVLCGG